MDPPDNAPQNPLDQLIAGIKEKWENLRIGDGHAAAMGRLGLTELRGAFNPSAESVASTEVGLYGTATQVEITRDRDFSEEGSIEQLDAKAEEMAKQHKDGPSQSRGMGR